MLKHCRPDILARGHLSLLHRRSVQCSFIYIPGISVTAPWAFNWFSDENGNKVLIQIIALGVYLESILIDADMAIQGQYKYTIGSCSNCATLDELMSLSNMEDKFTMCYLQQMCLIAKHYEVRVLEDM